MLENQYIPSSKQLWGNMDSIRYYDKKSKEFYDRTINADVQDLYQKFFAHLPKQARILDAGCGSGRDSKFFLGHGYDVTAFDGSVEMAKIASGLLNKEVIHLLFQEMDFLEEFHAIWANASLLHVPYVNLRETLQRFHRALLPSGILYGSFKYGTSMRKTEDRVFFDMDETNILQYLEGLFTPLEIWKLGDTRSAVDPSPDKSWLHFIAKRIDTAHL